MSTSKIFDSKASEYDEWYEKHRELYLSELAATRSFNCQKALEIGVGTGRFTSGTGVIVGVDPSLEMLKKVSADDVDLVQGVGESLPLRSNLFDCSFLIVTLCFVDNPVSVLKEAARVSERVIACIVPRNSPWGRLYSELAEKGNSFYTYAHFYTVSEIVEMASEIGLRLGKLIGTLSYPPGEERVEKPVELELPEAEQYGFVCVELKRGTIQ